MAEIFISYKSERRNAAAHLAKILECYGYSVWYDYSLVKGRDFAAQIDAKIREAKAVIVLWCSKSVRSEWVADEAALAVDLDSMVPAKIEPCELRVDFRRKDYVDLTGWDGAPKSHALDVLLKALEQQVGRAPQPDFTAITEYEEVWRRLGNLPLKPSHLMLPSMRIWSHTLRRTHNLSAMRSLMSVPFTQGDSITQVDSMPLHPSHRSQHSPWRSRLCAEPGSRRPLSWRRDHPCRTGIGPAAWWRAVASVRRLGCTRGRSERTHIL